MALEMTKPSKASVNEKLTSLMEQQHAGGEGVSETLWPGLTIGKFTKPVPRYPLMYAPAVCFVARGQKHVHMPDDYIVYNALHYLVVGIPLPLEAEIPAASKEKPFLAMALEIDISMVGALVLEMSEEQEQLKWQGPPAQALYTSPMNNDLLNAVERFLRTLENPATRRILGPGAVKEILFHLLRGEQGSLLRNLAFSDSSSHQIARVVHHLQSTCNEKHDIPSLARLVGMSNSMLHHAFGKFVGQSPMQYLKKIRLHRARLMMVRDGIRVSEASHRVGYNSPSQFSREFKRQFGLAPSRAAEVM